MTTDGPAAAPSPRDNLLSAAREVVARDGLEGLTLRAIARHAGVSHGAPLRHFPSLAALLAAMAADGFNRLVSQIDDALAAAERSARRRRGTGLDAVERLAVAGRGYIEFAVAEPGVFAVTFRPERVDVADPGYRLAGHRSFEQLVGLVTDAQAGGWQPDRPPALLAAVLWSHVHGLAELRLHGALTAVLPADQIADLHLVSTSMTLGVAELPATAEEAG